MMTQVMLSVSYLHWFSSEAGVHVLLEVRVLGGQVSEVRWFVFVAVPRMHRLIQRHSHSPESWKKIYLSTDQEQQADVTETDTSF